MTMGDISIDESPQIMTQWQDVSPLSTLHDVMTIMKPELSVDISQIDGGNSTAF